jgi:hypothetical protein
MLLKPAWLISSLIFDKKNFVQDTNLTFSEEEIAAIYNSRFFEVKLDITQKILRVFGELEVELEKKISSYKFLSKIDAGITQKGKIFRGENYRSLPYLILDCPRVFTTETVFAFRSMCWWGHEFSFTLHLQGKAWIAVRDNLFTNINMLKGKDFFFCVNDTPWEYFFEESNYKKLDDLLSSSKDITERPGNFIKLSRKINLAKYNDVISYGCETFELLMNAIQKRGK